jgi:hypothetical protein
MADNSGYELGYDKDGNVVLVPSQPKGKAAPRSRMSEGFSEAYGTPMGISEKDRAAFPAFSMVAGPVATAIDAARRLPGAIAGGISGGVGDLVEGATGDSGYANYNERQARALLDYLGIDSMARAGGPRPSANIPRNGEVFPPVKPGSNGYLPEHFLDLEANKPVDPLSQYRSYEIRPTGERAGPPTRNQAEARESARRPVIDSTYTPAEDLNTSRASIADPGAEDVHGTQGPIQPSNAPRWEAEAHRRANEVNAMEGEGGGAGRQANIQRLAGEAEADFRARQQATMDNEGPNTPAAVVRAREVLAKQKADADARFTAGEEGRWGDESGAITSGSSPPNPVQQALTVVNRPASPPATTGRPASQPMTPGAASAVDPTTMYRMSHETASTGRQAPPVRPELGGFSAYEGNAADTASMSPPGSPYKPYSLPKTIAVLGGASLSGPNTLFGNGMHAAPVNSRSSASMDRGNELGFPAGIRSSEYMDRNDTDAYPHQAARQSLAYMDKSGPGEDVYPHGAVHRAAPSPASSAPMPPRRPAEIASEASPGLLSGLFNHPVSTRDMMNYANSNPDDAGAYMRAERQYASTHRDNPSFDMTKLDENGMARGGAAGKQSSGGGSNAAIHKALEIIHHMLTRGQ